MDKTNFSTGLAEDNPKYNESLSWLYSQLPLFSRIGGAAYKPGLDNTIALDRIFSSPHKEFHSIHIAGTNGKGSVSHLLASILQEAGYKTGLYTSPHLVDFRERIRINGKMIPREKVSEFVDSWKNIDSELKPSFFELTMMMAFDWFAKEKVDVAVIEVGMGGRLDSTNIITPDACVITNISKDHTQFLGSTQTAIAAEKAGIIKQGIPVVIGEASGEVRRVFEEKAEETGAPIIFAEDERLLVYAQSNGLGKIDCRCSQPSFDFFSPLGGEYQKKNLNTVLCAVNMLRKCGYRIPIEDEKNGIERVIDNTGFKGRWTVLSERPAIIADTGHNEAGLSSNFRKLGDLMKGRKGGRLRIVFGMVADKDIDHILDMLPHDAIYYFTQASIPRALPAADLGAKAAQRGLVFPCFTIVKEAVQQALEDAEPEDIVYIGGSTFVVADYLA